MVREYVSNYFSRMKSAVAPYLFVLPTLTILGVFMFYPLIQNIYFSFFRFMAISPTKTFVGVHNFVKLVKDPVFWLSISNNIKILLGSVAIQVTLGFLLANIIGVVLKRGRALLRTIYFIPMVLSIVIVGLLWRFMYHPYFGLLNQGLEAIGLATLQRVWLGNPETAIYGILAVCCWQWIGGCMVFFLGGLQGIPEALYEAAMIDGATRPQCIWYITLPLLRKIIVVVTCFTMIGAFKVFDHIYVMTAGGPNHATEVLGTYLYLQAFTLDRMGYGTTIAIVLFLITFAASVVFLKLMELE
ncbi:MAG: ABC transporter permease subunit [Firmicutes bacterium]|nr:ABC transporter permease subunit [Bacillota bacterium]